MQNFDDLLQMVAEDEVAVSFLEKLLDAAERYFDTVVKMEAKLKMAQVRLDGQAFLDLAVDVEQRRATTLDGLVLSTRIFLRYVQKKYGQKQPFDEKDCQAIASWAGGLLTSLFAERKR